MTKHLTTMAMPEFLTIDEIANLFRTTPGGIYQRIHRTKKGRDSFPLPVQGLGKRHLWLRSEIERHIQGCVNSTSQAVSRTKPESLEIPSKLGIGGVQ